jgi:hypothetical protein
MLAVVALIVVPACSTTTSPSGSGITINGTVTTSATTERVGARPALSGTLTVTVVGTGVSTTVDGNGHFTFTGVAAGDVVLRFDGTGTTNATVTVSSLASGDTATIVISIQGNSATLVSDDRSNGNNLTQVEGQITSISNGINTFIVNGVTVETTAGTTIVNGSTPATFAALTLGTRVHVDGTPDGANLMATRIEIQSPTTNSPVTLDGTVSGFSGSSSSFQFIVSGATVSGDATTNFIGGKTFSDLKNGATVEVKGQQNGTLVTAQTIQIS